MASKKIGYVCSGFDAQLISYDDYADYIDDMLYLRELDRYRLDDYGAIVIPDFSDEGLLRRHADRINAYLAGGGFLIVFEPARIDRWLTAVKVTWFDRRTVDWKWWMKPGGRLEVYQPEPRHGMAEAIPLADMSWHFMGAYEFVEGATPILNIDDDEGCLMFDIRLPSGGRLIASTLDPHWHNGHRFMPATTRFLDGFYPWLSAELAG